MEKSFIKFKSFCNSLKALSEAKDRDFSDSFVVSGTGAKFSITFDLSLNVMKDIIIQVYQVNDFVIGSPREVLKKSSELGLIEEYSQWFDMLRLRNALVSDYDGIIIAQACEKIVNQYTDNFFKLKSIIENITDSEEGR